MSSLRDGLSTPVLSVGWLREVFKKKWGGKIGSFSHTKKKKKSCQNGFEAMWSHLKQTSFYVKKKGSPNFLNKKHFFFFFLKITWIFFFLFFFFFYIKNFCFFLLPLYILKYLKIFFFFFFLIILYLGAAESF